MARRMRIGGNRGIATGRLIVLPMVTKHLPSLGAPDDDGYLPTRRWWMGDSLRCFKSLCMSQYLLRSDPQPLYIQPQNLVVISVICHHSVEMKAVRGHEGTLTRRNRTMKLIFNSIYACKKSCVYRSLILQRPKPIVSRNSKPSLLGISNSTA